MTDFTQFFKYEESLYLQGHPGFATKAIHAGQKPDAIHGAVNVPVYLSSTYAQKGAGELTSVYDYSRGGNPTRAALQECVAAIEYGTHAIVFSSGCAAMTCVFHTLNPSHVLMCDDVYGGTNRYSRRFAQEKFNYNIQFTNLTNIEVVADQVKENTSMLWIETPTNPLLTINDIEGLVKAVKAKNPKIIVVVDNTFCSPYLQSPLLLGADISLNSATKYIGGHSDLIMGILTVKDEELHKKLFYAALSFGGCPGAMDCFLAMRGLKTLEARMKIHCRNAYAIAKFLETHPLVEKVIFPGLESHPQHELAKKQMRGFGGMISFYIKGGVEQARKFLKLVHLFTLAESLGGVESLIESPPLMTHMSVPEEQRKALGIHDNLVRISVGIEDGIDLMKDLDNALKQCQE